MMLILIGMFIGMIIGAISWHIGMLIADNYREKHGCYDYCEDCGKPTPHRLSKWITKKS